MFGALKGHLAEANNTIVKLYVHPCECEWLLMPMGSCAFQWLVSSCVSGLLPCGTLIVAPGGNLCGKSVAKVASALAGNFIETLISLSEQVSIFGGLTVMFAVLCFECPTSKWAALPCVLLVYLQCLYQRSAC